MNKNLLIHSFCLMFALLAFGKLGATQLNGIYTIDSSLTVGTASSFKNFTSAIVYLTGVGTRTDGGPANSAPFGISGPVVFNVATGTYNERVVITLISGVSPVNTITFDGGTGNTATRIIRYNSGTAGATRATVQINRCPYVTLRNLTIETTGLNTGWGINIIGNASLANQSSSGCKVKNCIVSIGGNGPVSAGIVNFNGIVINNSATSATTGARIDSLEIDSNTIRYGGYGILVRGASGLGVGVNNKIRHNNISFSYTYGIALDYQSNSETSNNNIALKVENTNSFGIFMSNSGTLGTNNQTIKDNRIANPGTAGIQVQTSGNIGTNKSIIANNTIVGGFQGTSGSGIYLSSKGWGVYHNSVNLDIAGSTSTSSSALQLGFASGVGSISIYNNILTVTGNGLALPFYAETVSHIDSMDYNLFYTVNPGNLIYVGSSFNKTNFVGGAGFNLHSLATNPFFSSNTDLQSNSFCYRGFYIDSISRDINGSVRSNPPAIGAYEYAGVNNISLEAIQQPSAPVAAGLQNIVVKVKNIGTNTVTSFSVNYSLNGAPAISQLWTGSLAPCDTTLVTFSGVNLLNENSLVVYTSLPNTVADSYAGNDTLNTLAYTPLSGAYTIGLLGADFPSFSAAITRLNVGGMSGPVTFNVQSGIYTEQIVVRTVTGISATNSITFKSIANHADSVILDYPVALSGAVVKLDNVNYVNFKYLTVRSATNSSRAFELTQAASYDSIIYCKTIAGSGIFANAFSGSKNVFSNNTITGVANSPNSQGIYILGSSNLPCDSNTIMTNMINAKVIGMSLDNGTNTIVVNNVIINAITGIINYSGNNQHFYHNSINAKNYGIQISYGTSDSNNTWRNNIITHSAAVGNAAVIDDNTGINNTWNYNLYYSTGADLFSYLYTSSPSAYASWRATGQDANSVVGNPDFVSETDLRLKKGSCGKQGILLDSVTRDILDSTRNNPPAIGAFEYFYQNDLAIDSSFQKAIVGNITPGLQNLTVKVKNTGVTPISSFTINYVLNNGSPISELWTGLLAPCDTVSVTFSTQIDIGFANTIIVYSDLVNGMSDDYPINDTVKASLYARLNGDYTIGQTGADFTSFNDAITRLIHAEGVSGAVRFNVQSGLYNEKVFVPAIIGTSAVNTITFQSADMNADSVLLSHVSAEDSAVVKLYKSSYINFKHISVTSSSVGRAFDLAETSSYDSIVGCKINGGKAGIYCGYSINASSGNAEKFFVGRNNVFNYNIITVSGAGVQYTFNMAGIFIESKSSNSKIDGDSNIIMNNTINSNIRAAISLTNTTAVQVLNNTINALSGTGILIDYEVDSSLIANNSIACNNTTGGVFVLTLVKRIAFIIIAF